MGPWIRPTAEVTISTKWDGFAPRLGDSKVASDMPNPLDFQFFVGVVLFIALSEKSALFALC